MLNFRGDQSRWSPPGSAPGITYVKQFNRHLNGKQINKRVKKKKENKFKLFHREFN